MNIRSLLFILSYLFINEYSFLLIDVTYIHCKHHQQQVVHFATPTNVCLERVSARTNHPTIPMGGGRCAIFHFKKIFELPSTRSGFRSPVTIRTKNDFDRLVYEMGRNNGLNDDDDDDDDRHLDLGSALILQINETKDLTAHEISFLKACRRRILNCRTEGMLKKIHITLMSSSETRQNRVKLRKVLSKLENACLISHFSQSVNHKSKHTHTYTDT